MIKKTRTRKTLAALCALMSMQSMSHAVDSTSFEYGEGNKTKITRIGAQWKWDRQWWKSNGTHIGAYWDLTLAQWHSNHFQGIPGNKQNITTIGLTPVFRLQNDNLKGLYLEGGIGAHLLSELYNNNNRKLSTSFQFGDHLGFGYVFPNNLDLGVKVQHFSNGSIKKPNHGVNFAVIRLTYSF